MGVLRVLSYMWCAYLHSVYVCKSPQSFVISSSLSWCKTLIKSAASYQTEITLIQSDAAVPRISPARSLHNHTLKFMTKHPRNLNSKSKNITMNVLSNDPIFDTMPDQRT